MLQPRRVSRTSARSRPHIISSVVYETPVSTWRLRGCSFFFIRCTPLQQLLCAPRSLCVWFCCLLGKFFFERRRLYLRHFVYFIKKKPKAFLFWIAGFYLGWFFFFEFWRFKIFAEILFTRVQEWSLHSCKKVSCGLWTVQADRTCKLSYQNLKKL